MKDRNATQMITIIRNAKLIRTANYLSETTVESAWSGRRIPCYEHMSLQWIQSLLDNLLRVATKLLFEEGTTFRGCESACL